MDHNVNESKGMISLADIGNLFISKLKLLIIVGVIAAIVGGALGAVSSIFGKKYEAVVKFHISPSDSSDTLLYNMQSEIFAESLLLDKNGLPPIDECENKADYDAALKAIAAYEVKREEKLLKKLEIEDYNSDNNMDPVESKYLHLVDDYNKIYQQWSILKTPQADSIVTEEHLATLAVCEENLAKAKTAMDEYYKDVYFPIVEGKTRLQGEYDKISLELNRLLEERELAVEKVLAPWRNLPEVRKEIALMMASATFEYTILEVPEEDDQNSQNGNASETDETIRNKGYITIKVSVPGDKEFAERFIDRIKSNGASFIVYNIENKTGSIKVDCKLLTPYSMPNEVNDKNIISNALSFACASFVFTEIILFGILLIVNIVKKKQTANEIK